MSSEKGWPELTREQYAGRVRVTEAWPETEKTGDIPDPSPRPVSPVERHRTRDAKREAALRAGRVAERASLRRRIGELQQLLKATRAHRDVAQAELDQSRESFSAVRRQRDQDMSSWRQAECNRLVHALDAPLAALEEMAATTSRCTATGSGLHALLGLFRSATETERSAETHE